MKKILSTSILALAGVAFSVPAANAALSYSTDNAEVVVAFSSGPAPHSGNTYLVDIGDVAQFSAGGSLADGNIHSISVPSSLADLSTAGISTSGAATWSLFGADPTGATNAAYLSKVMGGAPQPNGQTAIAVSDILNVVFTASQTTATQNPNSLIQTTTSPASYASYAPAPNTLFWEYTGNTEAALNGGVLDLYKVTDTATGGTPGTLLGAFKFNTTTGNIDFSSDVSDFAPVPEPATFAFGFAMLGACAMGRFRTRRQAAAELIA